MKAALCNVTRVVTQVQQRVERAIGYENDITAATRGGGATAFSEKDVIAGYQQVIAHAHLRGVRVAGCTLTPFGGSNVFTAEGERIRAAVNQWIRTSGAFDHRGSAPLSEPGLLLRPFPISPSAGRQ